MRRPFDPQLRLDHPGIETVPLDTSCRDGIVPILRALQHIYGDPTLRESILHLVAQDVNAETESDQGRPGLDYWSILVLAAVRQGCDLTYDRLHDLAGNHLTLRRIMGIGDWPALDDGPIRWTRIRDNVCRVQPKTIDAISHLIVGEGHRLDPTAAERVRGDTFVVQANIHYPTDSSLIGDGLRKIIDIAAELSGPLDVSGWRQHKHLKKKLRRLVRSVDRACASSASNTKAAQRNAYSALYDFADTILERALDLHEAAMMHFDNKAVAPLAADLTLYLAATDQVRGYSVRRVLHGEKISKAEKLFSMFEMHVQLIHRGKRPDPIEYGHLVFVIEDAAGFICHHEVMAPGALDQDVVIDAMKALQERLGGRIREASFDRGFHTPENQIELAKIIEHPCLAAKGVKKGAEQHRTASVEFRAARQRHPGVESAIHGLGAGAGLSRCRDRTKPGYDRYVSLAVLGRNLWVLGKLLLAREAPDSPAAYSERKRAG